MQVGSAKGDISGTLYWTPKPGGGAPVGAIAALLALVVLGAGAVLVVRRRRGAGAEPDAEAPAGAEAW